MTLVHEEVIRKDIKRHAGQVHLIETSGLVPSISNEAFIAPGKTKTTLDRARQIFDSDLVGTMEALPF